ncbi:MAG: hypothetical protein NTV62_02575, partial [Candidatus Gribaldobacteria bacterium]|nr:hypothetical protein [Candidatus Gribaldobacteria bacterium]
LCNATGATTTTFTLVALPNLASVAINQLANRGDGIGYRIRVIANGAGHTGVTEERTIVANTAGTTPLVTLNSALSFTPTATDHYEIISGTIYILGSGTTAAGWGKAWEVATNSISGNLSTTTLAGTIGTEFCALSMDEMYVPYNMKPGEGLLSGAGTYDGGTKQCVIGGASDGTSITGSGMSTALVASEYVNFQVRIVEDSGIPTAVGQRRKISANTGGASGKFTVAAWAVTPSATAKFVIELNNDLMLWTNAATVTYSYAAGGFNAAPGNWSTAASAGGATQYANPGTANGAGECVAMAFSIVPDAARNARHSFIYRFRGAGTVTLEAFNIAGAATGVWATLSSYGSILATTLNTGTSVAHDPATNQGRYFYINVNGTQRFMRFDMLNRCLEPWCYLRFSQGAVNTAPHLATQTFIDGATKVGMLYAIRHTGTELYNCLLQR